MTPTPTPSVTERHYTVAEIAKLWRLSKTVVYTLFADVAGVIRYNGQRDSRKRKYVTMRIPESVAARVHAAMTQEAPRFRKPTGPAFGKKSSVAAAASRSF